MKNKLKRIAFTLIELLLVMIIIMVLVGLFLANRQSATKQAEVMKTKYLLTKVAEAIRQFEQDWGELPPTTGHLVSPYLLNTYATAKAGKPTTKLPYLENVPTVPYAQRTQRGCEYYNLYPGYNHVHDIPDWDWNARGYPNCIDWRGVGYGGSNSNPGGPTGYCTFGGTYQGKIVIQTSYAIGSSATSTTTFFVSDNYGTLIYYIKNSNGTFRLISAGPDKLISIKEYDYMRYLFENQTLIYTKTSPKDDDNIEFGQ